jgi:hypothetical protein
MASVEPARRVEATPEEVDRWVEHKRRVFSSGEKVFTVEHLEAYAMDEAETWKVIVAGTGCYVAWATADGPPGGTYLWHAALDGHVYLLALDGDEVIPALRQDPRIAVTFDGGDGVAAATIRGHGEFVDDPRTLVRVILAAGRRAGLSESQLRARVLAARPGRDFVIRVVPQRQITFTHEKIVRG